jgi:hypothetical protein
LSIHGVPSAPNIATVSVRTAGGATKCRRCYINRSRCQLTLDEDNFEARRHDSRRRCPAQECAWREDQWKASNGDQTARRFLRITLEHAQTMAGHESPRTTKLYDRTKDRLTQDKVERIRL